MGNKRAGNKPMIIKIGPIYFEWERVQTLFSDDNQRLDGHIRFAPSKIMTDADIGEQRETQVLWHEVVHGISDTYGGDLSEKQVEVISNGVMDVIRHNKWLIDRTASNDR